MATGKYTRIDNRRSSSSYCSTVTIAVFVAMCLVGVWMMTSSSVVPVQNADVDQENKNEVKAQVTGSDGGKQSEDNQKYFAEDATKGDSNISSTEGESNSNTQESPDEKVEENKENTNEENKSEDGSQTETDKKDRTTEDGEGVGETKTDGQEEQKSDTNEGEQRSDSDEDEKKPEENSDASNEGQNTDSQIEEKVEQNEKETETSSDEKKEDGQSKNQNSAEVFPSGAQSELLNETNTQNGAWSTQAAESKNEKEAQQSSKQQIAYSWKVCNVTAGPDYIPCLDNLQAIKSLTSTMHYEHRERHCPQEPPTCLVPLPEGYRQSVEWPKSRDKIWYNNVPRTKLAAIKGHQNWVKVSGEYLIFPGGGTQFKNGALHYIDFLMESLPDIGWGNRTRVILDVGCGVASFGGFLFDRDVLAMSFAPKDEHEAQVQFALERGIPAISAVMGTTRLPYPANVFDVVHCARCRVPWHVEGGKLLLELNRVLRPGGFFVWSATPVYQKKPEDVEIWEAMKVLLEKMCWKLETIGRDEVDQVSAAIYRKPTTNECYENRPQNEPPMCPDSDAPDAAWNVPLQACMHKVPVSSTERGSQWPEQWPARLEKPPYWLLSSQVGVYGKAAPEDFTSDNDHWKRVVTQSYLTGMGINWATVRNVMDMRAIYGGFAAALKGLNVWVMNVVNVDAPDTLPIIYERGLFGMYHDWCESSSTYPRSYDLLHADHLFSKLKTRCNLVAAFAEVDRILRPEGKLIVRDSVDVVNELENMAKSMKWEVRMTYSKDNEGMLCVQKSSWRPQESETLKYAIA